MHADVSFSADPVLWVIIAIVVGGTLAGWFWVTRTRKSRDPRRDLRCSPSWVT